MGSSESKPAEPRFLSPAAIDEMSAPDMLKTYVKQSSGFMRALQFIMSSIAEVVSVTLVDKMTASERETWKSLQSQRSALFIKVMNFASGVKARAKVMRTRVKPNATLADIFAGYEKQKLLDDIEALQVEVATVRDAHKNFHDELVRKYRGKGSTFKRWIKAVGWLAGAVFGIGLLVAHFIPGVNIVLGIAEFAAVCAAVAGVVVGGTMYALSKDEVEQAIEYLVNVEECLRLMRKSLSEMHGSVDQMVDNDVAGVEVLLDCVEAEADRLLQYVSNNT